MTLDEDFDAEAAIEKIRELKGPGAIQSVKVVTCLAQLFIKTQGPLDDISLDLINMIRVIRMTHVKLRQNGVHKLRRTTAMQYAQGLLVNFSHFLANFSLGTLHSFSQTKLVICKIGRVMHESHFIILYL